MPVFNMSVGGQILHSCEANGVTTVYSAVKMKAVFEDGCGPSKGTGTRKLNTLAVTITTTTGGRCITKNVYTGRRLVQLSLNKKVLGAILCRVCMFLFKKCTPASSRNPKDTQKATLIRLVTPNCLLVWMCVWMVCRLGRVAVIVEVRLRREARVSVRATEEHTVALENVSTLPPVERMCFWLMNFQVSLECLLSLFGPSVSGNKLRCYNSQRTSTHSGSLCWTHWRWIFTSRQLSWVDSGSHGDRSSVKTATRANAWPPGGLSLPLKMLLSKLPATWC